MTRNILHDYDGKSPPRLVAAVEWIDAALASLGRRRTGDVEQPHVRPWSTVLRIPTDGDTLWFKANGPGTAHEPALLDLLGRLAPSYVVPPLAVDPDRGWSLSPDGGTTLRSVLGGDAGLAHWERILPAYGLLQRELSRHVEELIGVGVPDLTPQKMPGHLDRLLTRVGLADDVGRRLAQLRPQYAEWCAELAAGGIDPSLQHDDLHDGNVFVGQDGYRLFDFGDAVAAHPFGTLLVTLRWVADKSGRAAGAPELARLRDAYLEPWTAEHDRGPLRDAAITAVRVAKSGGHSPGNAR